MNWQKEWPAAPGFYWFYGFLSSLSKHSNDKDLYIVQVEKAGLNDTVYICNGGFLYRSDGAEGYFQKILTPELPKEA